MGDRLERIEAEIFNIGEAIEHLGEVSGCEDVIGELEDRIKVLSVERENAHRMAQAEHEREMAALRREYFRAVR